MRVAAFLLIALLTAPAVAQDMNMPGMDMSGMGGQMDHGGHGGHDAPAVRPAPMPDHSGHKSAPPVLIPAPNPPASALPPPVPEDYAADRYFPLERMDQARAALRREGRFTTGTVMIDQLEYRPQGEKDGYAWEGRFWYGGDIDRLSVSTEGEGRFGEVAESVELQAVWRHALDPWFNLELGVRHDFRPDPERSYAVIGIEGLAPYWFEVSSHVFVSDKGDVHLRGEAEYDQRITQRLILQPKLELNAALQDVPELGIGAGLDSLELGLRLRYEFVREFAPYVGVHWERKLGDTADFTRMRGENPSSLSAVIGIRAWF